jgi:hypothetical protein
MKTKRMWIVVGIAALGLYAGMAAAAETPVPEECLAPTLSPEVQRFCDQLRFADVPHYNVVRYAPTGAVRSVHLIDTETGRALVTSYPHGLKFAIADELTPGERDREVRVRTEDLQGALEGTPTPGAPTPEPAVPTGFATGLPIGWNASTGATSGDCLNYTIATPSNNVQQTSFSSQSAAASTAEQINVSATVNLAFDLFQANDQFTFSDQWQSSTNSTNQYYNLFSLYTLNTTVSSTQPLTEQGSDAVSAGTFNTLCGNEFLASVPVGMVATLSLNYGSSSSSTQQSITNTITASFGLDSVSTAVGVANQATNSSSYFTFSMTTYGGGTTATNALHNAFAKVNAQGEAFYALCAQGNTEACTQFTSNLGQGATDALNSFNGLVAGLSTATNGPDLSFLQIFPNGVAGATTPQAVTSPIPASAIPTNDVLAPFKPQLEQVLTLLNQIATLNNRVGLLHSLLRNVPSFNPLPLLDLVGYLDRLSNIYGPDRRTLRQNLANCLQATSTNVQSVCQPIINNQATNAYEYYGGNGPGSDFFAQQNTLALQYTGVNQDTGAAVLLALDVLYIDELPSFAGIDPPITGEAAFVGFVDRPVPIGGGGFARESFVDILALMPTEPLSTNSVSTKVRATPAAPSPFTFWRAGAGFGVPNPPAVGIEPRPGAVFISAPCTPTFANPCAIDYTVPPGEGFVQNTQIEGLFE